MPRKDPFRWATRPPVVGHCITVLKVTHQSQDRYWVLGDQVWGRDVHWLGDRSGFCTMDPKSCPYCRKEVPKRWTGWLHVCLPSNPREEGFLELTPLAAQNYLSQITPKEPMRGGVVLVGRMRKTNRSPLRIDVIARVEIPVGFPKPANPEATLLRLWGVVV
jgi:hypothetical protein